MSQCNTRNQKGFTILELMIATMVFSVILLGATTALIQIGKLYYKGVVSNRTQEVTRGIVDQIGQDLQFNAGALTTYIPAPYPGITSSPSSTLKIGAYCVGTTRYTYILNVQVNGSPALADNTYVTNSTSNKLNHALWRDTVQSNASCTPVNLSIAVPTTGGEELLADNMRLTAFSVNCDTNNICGVNAGVIYGDNDLLSPTPSGADPSTSVPTRCLGVVGSQWCAAAQFTTSVLKRIGN